MAVSDDAIEAGRVRLVPAARGKPDRFVELEGAPDLIVEIASDSSTRKDTQRLPASYHAAGVRELWLIDARRADVQFTINRWEPLGYVADTTSDGTSRSTVFGWGKGASHQIWAIQADRSGGPELVEPEAADEVAPGKNLDAVLGAAGTGSATDEDAAAGGMFLSPGPEPLEVVARGAIG